MKPKRLNAVMKRDGNRILWNQYNCEHCLAAGTPHNIINIPGPPTNSRSTWGPGFPTTMRQCTNCKRQDGPWISANLVGDY